jgi:putative heme transporter
VTEGLGAAGPDAKGRDQRAADVVPDWLVNVSALGWRVLAIGALIVILWLIATFLWTVTASIAIGIIVAAFFAPSVVRLRQRGMSRAGAAAVVWVAALALVTGTILLLAWALLPYAVELSKALDQAVAKVQAALASANVPPAVGDALRELLGTLRDGSGQAVSGIVANSAGAVTVVILAAFLVFFLLKDGDRAWLWIFQDVSEQNRERIGVAGDDALWRVGGYLRGTTIIAGIMAVTDYVFLVILGVPLAVPLAVLVFFSGYIPYIGGIIANVILLAIAYAAVGLGPAVALLVLIAVRNVILAYGVRPAVYGRTVSIHPAVALLALPAGFEIAGIVGLFAAVPVTAIVLAVARATAAILDPGPSDELPTLVPGWLDRVAQWSVRILVSVGAIALIVAVAASMPLVVIPLVLGTILAATLNPGVEALVRRGHPRGRSAVLLTGGGFLAVLGVLALTLVALVDQATAIGAGAGAGAEAANSWSGGQLQLPVKAIAQGGGELVGTIVNVAQSFAWIGLIVILSTLLAVYFLRDGGRLWERVIAHTQGGLMPQVDRAGRRAADVLGGYMIGTGVISFVGAASQLVIMLILGVPLALPVFVLSFILCFIPYVGGFISTGLAFLLTVAFGTPQAIVVMAIWTVVFNIVTGNVVGPLVYGKAVSLHPAVVLMAVPAGAAIAGIPGMFVIVPALGVVAATWRTVLAIVGQRRMEIDDVVAAPPQEMPPPQESQPPETAPGVEGAPAG